MTQQVVDKLVSSSRKGVSSVLSAASAVCERFGKLDSNRQLEDKAASAGEGEEQRLVAKGTSKKACRASEEAEEEARRPASEEAEGEVEPCLPASEEEVEAEEQP